MKIIFYSHANYLSSYEWFCTRPRFFLKKGRRKRRNGFSHLLGFTVFCVGLVTEDAAAKTEIGAAETLHDGETNFSGGYQQLMQDLWILT